MPSALRYSSLLCLLAAVLAAPAFCADELPAEQERLMAVGKLWVTVKFFHPLLAYRQDIDWDKALVDALPKVRAAKTTADYGAALRAMLTALQSGPDSGPRRTWIHYSLERSAFSYERASPSQPVSLDLGGGVSIQLTLSEPVNPKLAVVPSPAPDNDYATTPYPSTELRILAAYKLWGTVHYFFAYRDLMDTDWDDEFAAYLPKFIAAKDAREYHLAVAEAVTKLCDSNSAASSAVLDDYFGRATVGLRMRLVDKKPLVAEVLDDQAAKEGIQVGDIVTRVDDEDMVKRIDREAAYLPASTHQALSDFVMHRILSGPPGSEARLSIQHGNGNLQDVTLKRSFDRLPVPAAAAAKPLSAKIGYLDLTRLRADDVDAVFRQFSQRETIILDLRGDLPGSARAIAAHFNTKKDVAGAIITGPVVLAPDVPGAGTLTLANSFFTVEAVPQAENPYQGKAVLLIDERTIGEAEHLGLLLEAANKSAFVGTASAGAYGRLSATVLPGGITLTFSSTDVRHGNSGKLQRVGLEPTVSVTPVLADIRSGRDAILEKAVEFASSGN